MGSFLTGEKMTLWSADRRQFIALALLSPTLASCSAVGAFDALMPYDQNSRLAQKNIPFGPDMRQRLDVYVPNAPSPNMPVVLFIYGGSWSDGSKSDYGFVGRALSSRGYVTVIADYRLVPAIRFPAFVEDAALATVWIKANISAYGGNPQAIFAMGHSAGAYNAAMVTLDQKYVRSLGVPRQPFLGLIGLAGPYDFLPFDVKATRDAFGHWRNPDETQPILLVGQDAPPAFLATGADDTTVKPRNTESLASAFRRHGVPVEKRVYSNVGHASILTSIASPLRGTAPVLDDVVRFMRGIGG